MKKIKTIALVAPSGNIKNVDDLNQKIKILEKSFKVKKYYNDSVSVGYVSDTVENRVSFFENAFLDSEVDLVLSVRGGFGAIEIVDKIDYKKINCSKNYAGSSDATILLMALNKNTAVKCYHSLMLTNGFLDNLKQNIDIIENDIFNLKFETIKKGFIKGRLWGGNLSSLVSLFGGEIYIPNDDIVLFLEDLNEPLYKIDKMLFEIHRNQKLKEKIKGIIFGDFYFEKEEIMPLFKKYSALFNVPIGLNFNITHKTSNITLPFGKQVEIRLN